MRRLSRRARTGLGRFLPHRLEPGRLDGRVGPERVEEHRERRSAVRRRRREDSLDADRVRRRADGLTRSQVVASELTFAKADHVASPFASQIKDRVQIYSEPVELAGQEAVNRDALPSGQPVKLVGDRDDVEPAVDDCEAVGRVPPTTEDAYASTRTGIATGSDVPEDISRERCGSEIVDGRDERRERHALDEDAVGHRVDRTEHRPEVAAAQELDGLVMVERGVRHEEPVVCRARLQGLGEELEHGDELE